MSENITNIKASIAASQEAARFDLRRRSCAAKQPAITAYQNKEITHEEYQEATGETYFQTVEEGYRLDVDQARRIVRARVRIGLLTPEDYLEITGENYLEANV